MNTALRPVTPNDAQWLDAWLPDAARSVGYGAKTAADLGERATESFVIVRDGDEVGLVVASHVAERPGVAIIELVATTREHARLGSGMRAAAMMEDLLHAGGARAIYAPAPEQNGISVYFWIRLGYRPLPRAEWPCAPDGIAWMTREVSR